MSGNGITISVHCSVCDAKWSEVALAVGTARRHALEAGWQEVQTATALETRTVWRCPEHHVDPMKGEQDED